MTSRREFIQSSLGSAGAVAMSDNPFAGKSEKYFGQNLVGMEIRNAEIENCRLENCTLYDCDVEASFLMNCNRENGSISRSVIGTSPPNGV